MVSPWDDNVSSSSSLGGCFLKKIFRYWPQVVTVFSSPCMLFKIQFCPFHSIIFFIQPGFTGTSPWSVYTYCTLPCNNSVWILSFLVKLPRCCAFLIFYALFLRPILFWHVSKPPQLWCSLCMWSSAFFDTCTFQNCLFSCMYQHWASRFHLHVIMYIPWQNVVFDHHVSIVHRSTISFYWCPGYHKRSTNGTAKNCLE